MKINIINNNNLINSYTTFALQTNKIIHKITLININQKLYKNQTLNLLHNNSITTNQTIHTYTNSTITNNNIIIITTKLQHKPNKNQLNLINHNIKLFQKILSNIKQYKTHSNTIILIISNPINILTYLTIKKLDLPSSQIINLKTILNTTQLHNILTTQLKIPPTQMHITILNKHKNNIIPI